MSLSQPVLAFHSRIQPFKICFQTILAISKSFKIQANLEQLVEKLRYSNLTCSALQNWCIIVAIVVMGRLAGKESNTANLAIAGNAANVPRRS
jgi:hypothetical protein